VSDTLQASLPVALPGAAASFTVRRVQELLGLSRHDISRLVAAGFVAPVHGVRNEHRFSFQDLVLMRTAHGLRNAGIPAGKILRALARLKRSLPRDLPLTGLRITAVGTDVAVRDRLGPWAADTGQMLFDFEVVPIDGGISMAPPPAIAPSADVPAEREDGAAVQDALHDSWHWFERGETLEASDPAGAETAYRRAIELQPADVDAWLNLGAMLCDLGRFEEASRLYEQAGQHCPDSAAMHFNHAIALEDQGRLDAAIDRYRACLALSPGMADAHFNCGRLLERIGDARGAVRHFSAFRRLQHD